MDSSDPIYAAFPDVANEVKKLIPNKCIREIKARFGQISQENLEELRKNAEILIASPVIIVKVLQGSNKLRWAQTVSAGIIPEADRLRLINDAEVVFGDLPVVTDTVKNSRKIKWAQSTWAGVEYITAEIEKPPDGVQITRMGEGFGNVMAEFLIGYIIAKQRRFFKMYDDQKQKIWDRNKHIDFRLLSSSTIGVLGAGSIGTQVAEMCKRFGMTVWGLSRGKKERTEDSPFDVIKTIDELPDLLKECDYLCSLLPKTPETNNLLSGDVLSHCKQKSPEFINLGRGNIINEESLIKALNNKWLSGAVLDVYETEPIPKESQIWDMPNVIVTPHVSGPCLAEPIAKVFAKNYKKFIEGKPLDYTINWESGY